MINWGRVEHASNFTFKIGNIFCVLMERWHCLMCKLGALFPLHYVLLPFGYSVSDWLCALITICHFFNFVSYTPHLTIHSSYLLMHSFFCCTITTFRYIHLLLSPTTFFIVRSCHTSTSSSHYAFLPCFLWMYSFFERFLWTSYIVGILTNCPVFKLTSNLAFANI